MKTSLMIAVMWSVCLFGCKDPTGTCVDLRSDEDLERTQAYKDCVHQTDEVERKFCLANISPTCTLNFFEKSCPKTKTFFPEGGLQGHIRCKGMGFFTVGDRSQARSTLQEGGAVLLRRNLPAPVESTPPLEIGASFTKGAPNATVEVYGILDYQSPAVGLLHAKLHKLLEANPADVKIVLKASPLPYHKESMAAHLGAFAAGRQGKFWEMHDLLVADSRTFRGKGDAGMRALLEGHATTLGLDLEKFSADASDPKTRARVLAEAAEAQEHEATPDHIIIGEQLLTLSAPEASFESALSKARTLRE